MMLSVLRFLVLCLVLASAEEYSSDFKVDVDEILKNERLLKSYFDCVLDKGPCTPEGEELKKDIPDALQNGCAKCNENHKTGIKKVLTHIYKNKQDWWKELEAKFDPNGEYKEKYKDLIESELSK